MAGERERPELTPELDRSPSFALKEKLESTARKRSLHYLQGRGRHKVLSRFGDFLMLLLTTSA